MQAPAEPGSVTTLRHTASHSPDLLWAVIEKDNQKSNPAQCTRLSKDKTLEPGSQQSTVKPDCRTTITKRLLRQHSKAVKTEGLSRAQINQYDGGISDNRQHFPTGFCGCKEFILLDTKAICLLLLFLTIVIIKKLFPCLPWGESQHWTFLCL